MPSFHPDVEGPEIFSQVAGAKAGQPVAKLDEEHIQALFFNQAQHPPKTASFAVDAESLFGHHQHRIRCAFLGLFKESIPLPIQVAIM